jgi:hypothetical protein
MSAASRQHGVLAPGTDCRASYTRPIHPPVSIVSICANRPAGERRWLDAAGGCTLPRVRERESRQNRRSGIEQEEAMFAVVRHYHFKPQDGATIDRMVKEDFVPLIKKAKGFVRYYWLDTGNGEGASVSVFTDKAGADESIHLAADYVRDHMAKLVTQKPEIIEGPVKAHD